MEQFKVWLTSFIGFIVLDYIWLGYVVNNFLRQKLGPIANLKPDGSLNISYGAGLVAYALMATAMAIFIWPKIKNGALIESFLYSALAGLIIYGVYDFSNLSFAKYWPKGFAAEDILWGTVAFGITGIISKLIVKH